MSSKVTIMGREHARLDRALGLVEEAADVLHAAVSADDDGLELLLALAEVTTTRHALLDAGAGIAVDRTRAEPRPSAEEAGRAAAQLLRRAADELPREGEVTDDEFRALVDLWSSIHALRGWVWRRGRPGQRGHSVCASRPRGSCRPAESTPVRLPLRS